ncbi:MAG: 50S ribosomal protein L25 [Bacteroidales bacterium]
MKSIDIKGSFRKEVGKKSTKQLRAKGHVPCILYREGEVKHFEAPVGAFNNLVYSPDVYLVNLDIDGENYKAVMQDVHFHPVKDHILHIDFYQVIEKYPFWMRIPVTIQGVPAGVQEGGKPITKMRKLVIKALPKDMPDEIKVDVSSLTIGDSIRVADIPRENIEILDDENSVIFLVKSPRGGSAFALPEDELAEGEEGEEGEEAAEGEGAEASAQGGEKQESKE